MKTTYKTPAIVIGGGITALGVIRCLSKCNIPTYLITDRKDYVRFSRWANPVSYDLVPEINDFQLANLLKHLDFKEGVLFPCSDTLLGTVLDFTKINQTNFYSSLPSKKVTKLMINKDKFAEVLEGLQIPHPRTIKINSKKKLFTLKDEIKSNYFIKPCNSRSFNNQFNVKAFKVKNIKDAIIKFEMVQNANEDVVLQEYIPGPSNLHFFVDGFVDAKGEIKSLLARRRIRIYPPDFGNSSYCESISLHEVGNSIDYIKNLFRDLQFRGIFSAEFKFDQRDSEFKILEINARPWWYVEFAAYCGVNTCLQAYQDALNLPITQFSKYRSGLGCMHGYHDYLAIQNNSISKISKLSWITRLVKSRGPFYIWNDPLPGMHVGVKFINYYKNKFLNWFGINKK